LTVVIAQSVRHAVQVHTWTLGGASVDCTPLVAQQ
jgi:hypothetical protein